MPALLPGYGVLHRRRSASALFATLLIVSGCVATPPEDTVRSRTQAESKALAKWTPASLQERFRDARGSLPEEHFTVDWVQAVKDGLISPKASIEGREQLDLQVDFDVIFRTRDPLLKDVRFSHAIHTYWLKCESCHTDIFVPVEGSVVISMGEIWDGQYCGRCHGKVSFDPHVQPGANFRSACLRCHSYERKR